jgi:hypothetical protein
MTTQVTAPTTLYSRISARSLVTIVTPRNQTLKGRAVMQGPAGWVLNTGGRYGNVAIASEANVVAVSGGRRS